MAISINGKYWLSLRKLDGKIRSNFSPASSVISFPSSGNASDCTVTEEPNGKNKPLMTLTDGSGHKIISINGRATTLRKTLKSLEGKTIASVSWNTPSEHWCNIIFTPTKPKTVENPITSIYLDTETTGLNPQQDEILQLSIVDNFGNKLWNKYYRPTHTYTWPEAEAINHITPQSVADKPTISQDLPQIQSILDRASAVYAWNAQFDLAFLAEAGLTLNPSKAFDSMQLYAQKFHYSQYCKLDTAANECGYQFEHHDALEDALATYHIQNVTDSGSLPTQITTNSYNTTPINYSSGQHSTPHAHTKHGVWFWILISAAIIAAIALFVGITLAGAWPTVIIVLLILIFLAAHFLKKR